MRVSEQIGRGGQGTQTWRGHLCAGGRWSSILDKAMAQPPQARFECGIPQDDYGSDPPREHQPAEQDHERVVFLFLYRVPGMRRRVCRISKACAHYGVRNPGYFCSRHVIAEKVAGTGKFITFMERPGGVPDFFVYRIVDHSSFFHAFSHVGQYIESLANPQGLFRTLRDVVPLRNPYGELRLYAGNFSVVFKVGLPVQEKVFRE